MIILNKLKNRLRIIGFMISAAALTSCTTTAGNYWGSDARYVVDNTNLYYIGYNDWDRAYYNYDRSYYYRGGSYGDGFYPSTVYYYGGARR